jgi:hypothetical protein
MGDMDIAVSIGAIPGYANVSRWNERVFTTGTQREMSNFTGIRTLPTSGGEITIVSTSQADNGTTATGALSVRINYLDSDLEPQTTTMVLDGTTPVVSSGLDAYRFDGALVASVGSELDPAGTITITMDGNTQAIINAGQNESRESGFTVPAGKAFLSTHAVISSGVAGTTNSLDFALEYRLQGSTIWYTLRSLEVYQQVISFDVVGVALLPAGADFRVLATKTGAGTKDIDGYVQIRGFLIDTATQGNFN